MKLHFATKHYNLILDDRSRFVILNRASRDICDDSGTYSETGTDVRLHRNADSKPWAVLIGSRETSFFERIGSID